MILHATPEVWVDMFVSRVSQDKIYVHTSTKSAATYSGGNAQPADLNTFHGVYTHQTDTVTSCKSSIPQNCKFTVPAVYSKYTRVQKICQVWWKRDLLLGLTAAVLAWEARGFPKVSDFTCTHTVDATDVSGYTAARTYLLVFTEPLEILDKHRKCSRLSG